MFSKQPEELDKGGTTISILEMNKVRFRKFRWLAQCHEVYDWQNEIQTRIFLTSSSFYFSVLPKVV